MNGFVRGRVLYVGHHLNAYDPVTVPVLPLAPTALLPTREARKLPPRPLLDRQGAIGLAAEVVVEIILSRLERP